MPFNKYTAGCPCCDIICCNERSGLTTPPILERNIRVWCQCSANIPAYSDIPNVMYHNVHLNTDGSINEDIETLDNTPNSEAKYELNEKEPVWGFDWFWDIGAGDYVVLPSGDIVNDTILTINQGSVRYIGYDSISPNIDKDVCYLEKKPNEYGTFGGVKHYKYTTHLTNHGRNFIYESLDSPEHELHGLYDSFNSFELNIKVDESKNKEIYEPPYDFEVEPPVPPLDIELYTVEESGQYYAQDCVDFPHDSPAESGLDSIEVGNLSIENDRSNCFITIICSGEFFTSEWVPTYPDENTISARDSQPEIIQGPLYLSNNSNNLSQDQIFRYPFIERSAQFQLKSPNTVPRTQWRPIRAWKGKSEDKEDRVVKKEAANFILPNNLDWRDTCLYLTPKKHHHAQSENISVSQPSFNGLFKSFQNHSPGLFPNNHWQYDYGSVLFRPSLNLDGFNITINGLEGFIGHLNGTYFVPLTGFTSVTFDTFTSCCTGEQTDLILDESISIGASYNGTGSNVSRINFNFWKEPNYEQCVESLICPTGFERTLAGMCYRANTINTATSSEECPHTNTYNISCGGHGVITVEASAEPVYS